MGVFGGGLLFKMATKCVADVLSSVPQCEKPVLGLAEKICVLDKLHSGMTHSAVGREFNADESTILNNVSLNRNIHMTKLCTDQLLRCYDQRLAVTTPCIPLGAMAQHSRSRCLQ